MIQLLSTIKRFLGESGDIKPTDCPPASTFFEKDTGNLMIFQDGKWSLKDEGVAALRVEMLFRLDELLIQAKKSSELLETIASAMND